MSDSQKQYFEKGYYVSNLFIPKIYWYFKKLENINVFYQKHFSINYVNKLIILNFSKKKFTGPKIGTYLNVFLRKKYICV